MASPALLDQFCGAGFGDRTAAGWLTGEGLPAWIAFGFNGLSNPATALGAPPTKGLITYAEAAALYDHMIEYRRIAAGNGPDAGDLAKPVAPPDRPESISVDHHDPYLINYRGEPAPLRLGTGASGQDCAPKSLADWAVLLAGQGSTIGRCSVDRQKPASRATRPSCSPAPCTVPMPHPADRKLHRRKDPDPPDPGRARGAARLHAGRAPMAAQHRSGLCHGRGPSRPLGRPCRRSQPARGLPARRCRPRHRSAVPRSLARGRPAARPDQPGLRRLSAAPRQLSGDVRRWGPHLRRLPRLGNGYEKLAAGCANLEGFVTAQEIGISEHFEFKSAFRHDVGGAERADDGFVIGEEGASAGTGDDRSLFDYGDGLSTATAFITSARLMRCGMAPGVSCVSTRTEPRLTSPATPAPAFFRTPTVPPRLLPPSANAWQKLPVPTSSGLPPGSAAISDGEGTVGFTGAFPCAPGAETLRATIVAVSARSAFGSGLPHGGGLSDPDGLFLSLVPDVDIGPDFRRPVTAAERSAMLASIRSIHGPKAEHLQPLVLPVTAGTCLQLTVVNLLNSSGLPDGIGDAPLPPITPLNVGIAHAPRDGARITMEMAAARGSTEITGLRPSNHLVLKLGLPTLNALNEGNEPFGQNPSPPLDPGWMEKPSTTPVACLSPHRCDPRGA